MPLNYFAVPTKNDFFIGQSYATKKNMSDLSLREYGYAVDGDVSARMYALKLAAVDYGRENVVDRLRKLSQFHPKMKDDIALLEERIVPVDVEEEVVEVGNLKEACDLLLKIGSRIPFDDAMKAVQLGIDAAMEKLAEEDREFWDFTVSWEQRKKDNNNEFAKMDTEVKAIVNKYKDIMVPMARNDTWNSGFNYVHDETRRMMEEIMELDKNVKGRRLHLDPDVEDLREKRRRIKQLCEECLVSFRKVRVLSLQKRMIDGGC